MNKRLRIFVLCYPHLGTLDNWLPVVNRLNDLSNHVSFTLVIPNLTITRGFHKDNAVIRISNSIFDQVLIHIDGKKWIKHTLIFDSIKWYRNNRVVLRLLDIFKRFSNKFLFRYVFKLPLIFLQNNVYKEECKIEYKDINSTISQSDTLFYDIGTESNPMVLDVLKLFKNNKKYSLPHALSMLNTDGKEVPILKSNIDNKESIKIYIYAKFQSKYYEERYKINADKIRVVGIPRHYHKWIKVIQKESPELPTPFGDDSTIAVLSRHVDAHLSSDEKIRSLQNIKKIFIDKLGMKVVVKLHPNEKQERIRPRKEETIYEDVFSLKNYGSTWVYSDLHVLALCKGKKLAVSLYTGTIFDAIVSGVPCIEYIDKINNSREHIKDSTQFIRYGFVEGASNYLELCDYVDRWLRNPKKIITPSINTYKKYFPVSNVSDFSEKIATEILYKNSILD